MKRFFSLALILMGCISAMAQSSQVATLNHNGTISAYYGRTAYKDALSMAGNGDIISLSQGSFVAADITKAVTIRGEGMIEDSIAGTFSTDIIGAFSIEIPDSIQESLKIEGIYYSGMVTGKRFNKASFIKCSFSSDFNCINNYESDELTFIHCKITYSINVKRGVAYFLNSFIRSPISNYNSDYNASFEFTNCVIEISQSLSRSLFNNCIIYGQYGLSTNNTAYNCVGICTNSSYFDLFQNLRNPNVTNSTIHNYSEIFKTFTGYNNYNNHESFELSDEAKSKYIGNDGTQIGLYGGNIPFSATPLRPIITKMAVASKSTTDGKLSVDIEVSAAE